MRSTGIVRRIDSVGRLIIPCGIRKMAKINNNDAVEIYMEDDNKIILKKYSTRCIFCSETDDIEDFKGKPICKSCMEELKLL